MFSIPDESFKSFETSKVKLLAKETKWTSLEVRTHATFLEILISKCDFGPVKLPGLQRNGPQGLVQHERATFTEVRDHFTRVESHKFVEWLSQV